MKTINLKTDRPKVVTLVLDEQEALIIRDALDILNPDDNEAGDIQERLARAIERAVRWEA